MRINQLFLLFFAFISFAANAQRDTMRYEHKFRLPTETNASGYEKKITQYASDVHSFVFHVPDSCTVYIVVRSENDSLDIRLGNTVIDLSSKQDGKYVYGFTDRLPRGENILFIRSRKYCSYTVYVKGQL